MTTQEHFAALRARAQRMQKSNHWLWGAVVALVGVGVAWAMLGSLRLVADRSLLVWGHVSILLMVLAIVPLEYLRRLNSRLAHLRQEYAAHHGPAHGGERQVYAVKYDFAEFTLADFETHRMLRLVGNWVSGAFLAYFTWAGVVMCVTL